MAHSLALASSLTPTVRIANIANIGNVVSRQFDLMRLWSFEEAKPIDEAASIAVNMPAQHALAMLREFRRHVVGANFHSFDLAESFLGLVSAVDSTVKVSAQVFGINAVLNYVWDGASAQIEFLPDGDVAANIDVGTDEWDIDTFFNGMSIPDPIADKLIDFI